MADRPPQASGYTSEKVKLVREACLFLASKLGDLMDDLVVVGGLVPSLLIDQRAPSTVLHAGTMDLDIGLSLAVLVEGRYRSLSERLRGAGFSQDKNEAGNRTRQRWRIQAEGEVTVDFLIPPSRPNDRGGQLQSFESDFAAIVAPGLHLAFEDREEVSLTGDTLFGERATRSIWSCGPGAFVVLKALAFDSRGENKDAYDLYYVLRYFGRGIDDVVTRIRPLLDDPTAQQALDILGRDFLDHDGVGPRRVAEFQTGGPDDQIQADVVGFVTALIEGAGRKQT